MVEVNEKVELRINDYGLNSYIKSIINDIKKEYDFLGITNDEWYSLVQNNLKQVVNLYNQNMGISYFDYIKKVLYEILNNYIVYQLEENQSIQIIENYVNSHIIVTNNYNLDLRELEKISDFFDKINYVPSLDLCISIISACDKLYGLLSNIVLNEIDLIQNDGLGVFSKDNILKLFIEAYCDFKGIRFDKIGDNDSDDNISFDRKLLNAEEEMELLKRAKAGDIGARNKLIEKNQGLIRHVARKYTTNSRVSLQDLYQEGNFGLIKAIDKFDFSKNCKFSTYATYWIRQAIGLSFLATFRDTKLTMFGYNSFLKMEEKLTKELNRKPTIEELSIKLGWELEKIVRIISLKYDSLSLDNLIYNGEINNLVYNEDEEKDEKDRINVLFEKCNLTPIEKYVLKEYIGFFDAPKDISKIGETPNLDYSKILNTALDKIRNSEYGKTYLEHAIPNNNSFLK